MKPIVCSHTRCGVHYLATLLHTNLYCGVEDYEQLHFSHSRLPEPLVQYIHLHRPLLPTMVSIWKARTHLGIHDSVSFSQMVRTPWEEMPRSEIGPAYFNGEAFDRVCSPRPFTGTLPERWVRTLDMFQHKAAIALSYGFVTQFPYETLLNIARMFDLSWREGTPKLVLERRGFWAAEEQMPCIPPEDILYLEGYQSRCRFSY